MKDCKYELSYEATPKTTGWFEVTVDGELVHSKKDGEGLVDNEAKWTKVCQAIKKKC